MKRSDNGRTSPPEIGGFPSGMARLPRVVVPGLPHPMPQRGNRRQRTFFKGEDYAEYRILLADVCRDCGTQVLTYCLMPNPVHLVLVCLQTTSAYGTRWGKRIVGITRTISVREGRKGHPWQERFHSFVMDERHLIAAAQYVERDPVRARLCVRPQDWPWSSAAAHLAAPDDSLVTTAIGNGARLGGFLGRGRRRACRRSAAGSRQHRTSARNRCVRRVVGAAPPVPFEARKARAKAPRARSLYRRPARRSRAELGKLSPEFEIVTK